MWEKVTGGCRKLDSYSILYTKYYCGDQIKMNEIYGACSTHGREEKILQTFSEL
jgi:hypothetical protein